MDVNLKSKKLMKLAKKYGAPSDVAEVPNGTPLSAASVYKSQSPKMSKDGSSDLLSPRPKRRKKKKNAETFKVSPTSSSINLGEIMVEHVQMMEDADNLMADNETVDENRGNDEMQNLDSLSEPQSAGDVSLTVDESEDTHEIIHEFKKGELIKQNAQEKCNKNRRASSINLSPVPRTVPMPAQDRFVAALKWKKVSNGSLLYLPKYTSFALKGRIKLTVLKGKVEVMGAILEASSKSYEIYSPRGYSLVVVNALDSLTEFDLQNYLTERQLLLEDAPDFNEVLLLLERINNNLTKFLEEHIDLNLLRNEPTLETSLTKEELRPQKDLHQTLQCNILTKQVNAKARYYEENPEWRNVAANILELANPTHCRVALCGGKGVGKSTLLRYLVNNLLKVHQEVLVIDVDPGQAEFTMPTCMSVVSVTEPLFGPNFTHLKKAEKSFYIGTVDVSSDVTTYAVALRKLFYWFTREQRFHSKPCIINTMGFNSGIGVDLLVDTIRISNPSHVVEITSRSPKRNYPFALNPHTVSTVDRGRLTKQSPGDFLLSYQHFKINSASESAAQPVNEWGHKPAQLREYVVLAYFSQLMTGKQRPSQAIASAKPVRIPFSQVAVASIAEAIKPQFMLNAVNGSLVSLCTAEMSNLKLLYPDDPTLFMIANQPQPVDCIGFGIVTRIDAEARCFYIVTPEPDVSAVNLLCLGKLTVPDCVYMGGVSQNPFDTSRHPGNSRVVVPYAAVSLVDEGISQPFRHYNPFRVPRMS